LGLQTRPVSGAVELGLTEIPRPRYNKALTCSD